MLSAGSFRVPKPLRVQCQTCLMNCSRARSICFVERNRIRARRRSSIGASKTPLPESPKRRKDLFCRVKWDCFPWASSVLLMGIPKACSPTHYEYSGLSVKSSQTLRIQWFERIVAFRSVRVIHSASACSRLEASERRSHCVCNSKCVW